MPTSAKSQTRVAPGPERIDLSGLGLAEFLKLCMPRAFGAAERAA
jgi:hypothetical protein